jgi:hypothetical protein
MAAALDGTPCVCIQPPLHSIPKDDWLCPHCVKDGVSITDLCLRRAQQEPVTGPMLCKVLRRRRGTCQTSTRYTNLDKVAPHLLKHTHVTCDMWDSGVGCNAQLIKPVQPSGSTCLSIVRLDQGIVPECILKRKACENTHTHKHTWCAISRAAAIKWRLR